MKTSASLIQTPFTPSVVGGKERLKPKKGILFFCFRAIHYAAHAAAALFDTMFAATARCPRPGAGLPKTHELFRKTDA